MPLPAPDYAYLVLATPRSGSTLLCEALRESGVAGRPLEHFEVLEPTSLPRQPREYFLGVGDPAILERLAPLEPGARARESPEEWWARIVREGTGENGVWGGKLMWRHTQDLLRRARRLENFAGADLATTLRRLLGDPKLILVVREDKIAQAISLWRAVQTKSWRAGEPARGALYSFAGIDYLRRQLEADETAWRTWLADYQLPHHEVRYSELAANPVGVVDEVLHVLGLSGGAAVEPPLQRQGDSESVHWAERYRAERAHAERYQEERARAERYQEKCAT